ncbi:MAG: AbgT family transporter [Acidaminococcus sp.]|nr:AbgT family transporter [Acidaminococcus sp.]
MVKAKKSLMNRFIDIIEKGGNKLPHPFILFGVLVLVVMVLSFIFAQLGTSISYFSASKTPGMPGKEVTVKVVNLLSGDNLKYLITKYPDIYVGYTPMKLTLIMMAASAFIDKTGFFETLMKKYLLKAPKSLITFAVAFMAVNANLMSDAGTFFSLAMGGVIFHAMGRNPLIGVILGYAGCSGGFTANLFLAGTDALLAGITENIVEQMGLSIPINPAINYFFMAASTFFLAISLTLFTEKVVCKMVGDGEGVVDRSLLDQYKPTPEQEKGLRWAGYGFLVFLAVMASLTVMPNALLRNKAGGFLPKSPLFQGIIMIIAFLFVSTGLPYAVATGQVKKGRDLAGLVSAGLKTAVPLMTTTFMACVFIDMVNKSNIFKIVAIAGAELLKGANVGILPLCLLVIFITTLVNPFMTSGSSKWLLIAPMIVPMFVMLDVHPAYAQLAYRIGDSCTNICSPLHSALPVIIGLLEEYQAEGKIPLRPGETEHHDIGMGTVFSLTIPYSMVLLATMVVLFVVWMTLNLPIGPGVTLHI